MSIDVRDFVALYCPACRDEVRKLLDFHGLYYFSAGIYKEMRKFPEIEAVNLSAARAVLIIDCVTLADLKRISTLCNGKIFLFVPEGNDEQVFNSVSGNIEVFHSSLRATEALIEYVKKNQ